MSIDSLHVTPYIADTIAYSSYKESYYKVSRCIYLPQWIHSQPVRGYRSEYIAGIQVQESLAVVRINVGGGGSWHITPTSGGPSLQGMQLSQLVQCLYVF